MSKVAVHGAYFANNFGDTVLIELLCKKAADIVGAENVVLARKGNALEQRALGYPVLAEEDRGSVDFLLFSGGGYFGEPPANLYRLFKASRRVYRNHLSWVGDFRDSRKAILGVGVGPLTFGFMRRPIRALFRSASVALVRDRESFDYCRKYDFPMEKIDQCVDLALSIPAATRAERSGTALHLQTLDMAGIETILRALKGFENGRLARDVCLMFDCPTWTEDAFSAQVNECARAVLGRELPVKRYEGHRKLMDELGGYELVITSKLHVGIVTIALGGKVLSVPHHTKTPRLYRQLGLSDYCLPAETLTQERFLAAAAKLPAFAANRGLIDEGVAKITRTVEGLLTA